MSSNLGLETLKGRPPSPSPLSSSPSNTVGLEGLLRFGLLGTCNSRDASISVQIEFKQFCDYVLQDCPYS